MLATNKIYICDVFRFLESLQDNSIDLAIIDLPYNLNVDKSKNAWDTFKTQKEFLDFSFAWIDLMLLKIKKTGSFYIFNTPFNNALFLNHLQSKNVVFQNWITWYKKDGFSANKRRFNTNQESILFYTMQTRGYYFDADSIRVPYESVQRINHAKQKGILKNGKRWYPNAKGKLCPDVWEISSERHKRKIDGKTQKLNYPTIKPKIMLERMIKASSKEGDLVLDCFSGSGSVSLVAHKLGREFIGCEIHTEYLDSSLEIFTL